MRQWDAGKKQGGTLQGGFLDFFRSWDPLTHFELFAFCFMLKPRDGLILFAKYLKWIYNFLMYEQVYRIEVNVICLLILFWIIFRLRLFADKQTRNILFSRVIVENFFLIFLDTLMVFFSGKTSPFFYALNWLFNLLYIILNACTAYSWFSYVIYTLFENKKRISVVNKFCAIPLVIFIFMSVVSIFTKWIFFF